MSYPIYPSNCTGETAYYCLDGPPEQVKEHLKHLIFVCEDHIDGAPDDWNWDACRALMDEAKKYLAEFHD